MEYDIKKRLSEYLKSHDDGTVEAKSLISHMDYELQYADCNSHSVSADDLEAFGQQRLLRTALSKPDGEKYTIDDCISVADALAESISESFSEDMDAAVRYFM